MAQNKFFSVVLLLVLGLGLVFSGCSNSDADTGSEVQSDVQKDSVQEEGLKQESDLKQMIEDGDYSYDVDYNHPAGLTPMKLDFAVENGVVTSFGVSSTQDSKWVKEYNENVQELVVGKKVDEVDLPHRVSGSSLTAGAVKQKFDKLRQ